MIFHDAKRVVKLSGDLVDAEKGDTTNRLAWAYAARTRSGKKYGTHVDPFFVSLFSITHSSKWNGFTPPEIKHGPTRMSHDDLFPINSSIYFECLTQKRNAEREEFPATYSIIHAVGGQSPGEIRFFPAWMFRLPSLIFSVVNDVLPMFLLDEIMMSIAFPIVQSVLSI